MVPNCLMICVHFCQISRSEGICGYQAAKLSMGEFEKIIYINIIPEKSHLNWETTRLERMTNTEESIRDLKFAVTSEIKTIFIVRK